MADLSDRQKGIVYFAVAQLAGVGSMGCPRKIHKVGQHLSLFIYF